MFRLETSIPSLIGQMDGWIVGLQKKIINIFDFKQNIKNKLKTKPQIKSTKKGKIFDFQQNKSKRFKN